VIEPGVVDKLRGTLEQRVGALFELANWQAGGPAASTLVGHLVSHEAKTLLHLVKENTLVVQEPFREFADRLAELLSPRASQRGLRVIRDIKALFAGYRRNPGNFISQRNNVVVSPVDGLTLAYVCPTSESFLIVSTKIRPFLVNYDLSTDVPSTRDGVLRAYGGLVGSRGPLQLCLVRKEYGPKGPIRFRDELRATGPRNVVVYAQDRRDIAEGQLDPQLPVLVLYDLIASGAGISGIMARLCDALRRLGGPAPTVWAHALYAYSGSQTPNGVKVLHHATAREDEEILRAPAQSLEASDTPFENTQLGDVDPLSRLSVSMARDLAFARSTQVAAAYPGQWVAVRNQQVLAAGDTREAVRAAARGAGSNIVIEYADDLSREY